MKCFGYILRVCAAAAVIFAATSPREAFAAPVEPPFTPAERALIQSALGDCADRPVALAGSLDDQALWAAMVRRATVELGQRIRPAQIDRFWSIQPPRRDVEAEFAAARQDGTLARWVGGLSPTHPQYRALIAACRRYSALANNGGWDALPDGPPLREGDRDPQVPVLRLRLAREGFAPATAEEPELFDAALAEAVTEFQRRRGLEVDGVVGPRTRTALNVTAGERLSQIQANLERWRWMPRVLPAERMEVDAGGATATFYRNGTVELSMRAIVGDPKHRTPMFSSRLESILFNPPWNVPTSIAVNELWPKERRSPGYLRRNHFVYKDGRLVQLPGDDNALGYLKFDLPSPFGVYLHDTSARSLFQRNERHLSHGCMRLEKPRELAVAVLQPQGGTVESVDAAIAEGVTARVQLERTVPLYVTYWTAVAGEDGQVDFRPDVYGWDEKLMAALAEEPPVYGDLGLRAALSRTSTDCKDVAE